MFFQDSQVADTADSLRAMKPVQKAKSRSAMALRPGDVR